MSFGDSDAQGLAGDISASLRDTSLIADPLCAEKTQCLLILELKEKKMSGEEDFIWVMLQKFRGHGLAHRATVARGSLFFQADKVTGSEAAAKPGPL